MFVSLFIRLIAFLCFWVDITDITINHFCPFFWTASFRYEKNSKPSTRSAPAGSQPRRVGLYTEGLGITRGQWRVGSQSSGAGHWRQPWWIWGPQWV